MAFSQIVINYERHALVPDKLNEMKLAEFMEPGADGINQVWDFSTIQIKKDFEGFVDYTSKSAYGLEFSNSNAVLDEFGNKFFFNVSKSGIEHYGMVSKSGNTIIKYTTPFIKMKYPFAFGDNYTGAYTGTYANKTKVFGDINAQFLVEADAWGKLILPGNTYENSLRVKTIREITRTTGTRSYQIIYETYRWYVENHRFPLLVLSTTKIINSENNESVSYKAAFNDKVETVLAVDDLFVVELKLYPNPVKDQFTMEYELAASAKVSLELYDISGKRVQVFIADERPSGYQKENFTLKNVRSGNYFLRMTVNDKVQTQRLSVVK